MNSLTRSLRSVAVLALAVTVAAGCYHATLHTGLTPSPQQERVERRWAHGFLYGLVPPAEVHASNTCTAGVARVETEHSFLNVLATGLTFGLYSPMTIVATCADAATDR